MLCNLSPLFLKAHLAFPSQISQSSDSIVLEWKVLKKDLARLRPSLKDALLRYFRVWRRSAEDHEWQRRRTQVEVASFGVCVCHLFKKKKKREAKGKDVNSFKDSGTFSLSSLRLLATRFLLSEKDSHLLQSKHHLQAIRSRNCASLEALGSHKIALIQVRNSWPLDLLTTT